MASWGGITGSGEGTAGLAATLQAKKQDLRYVTLEQDDIGGAVLSYPRQKLVMTQPMDIPLYGKFKQREIRTEELLALWLELIAPQNGHFALSTTAGHYAARKVILCIGKRGTPKKLGVAGEKSAKVAYQMREPGQYENHSILVVGGGDSAVEAALTLADQRGTDVSLSYRKNTFSRIKEDNRVRIQRAMQDNKIKVLFESQVSEIKPLSAVLQHNERELELANDYVLVFIGGELPTAFLNSLGIEVKTKYGEK